MERNNYSKREGLEIVTSQDFPELNNKVVVRDIIPLNGNNKHLLRLISKNSPIPQGVVLEILGDGGTLVINEQPGKRFVVWEEYGVKEIEITSVSCNGALGVYNISKDEEGRLQSLVYGSGMIVEELGNSRRVYHCNDFGVENAKFDKFVFSIEPAPDAVNGHDSEPGQA